MTKIYAPNKRYTGLIAGVSFIDGVGETDNKYLINWFEEKGYTVESEIVETEENLIEDIEKAYELAIKEDPYSGLIENTIKEELKGLTVKELKELASASNIEGYSNMKKEELIEAILKL